MDNKLLKKYNNQRNCKDISSLCHAPSYSMHFAKNGTVSACSFTRFAAMGKYPDQSIEEIWFGKRAESIRHEMKKSTFPASCVVCGSDAESANFGQMRAVLYEQYARSPINKVLFKTKNFIRESKFSEYPRVISFELSNTCNLECIMCVGLLSSSIRKNRDKLPPLPQMYGKEFLPQLKPFIPHLEEAKFFGGEPFLIDIYLDIWEMFIELNPKCKIYITTNGTILNNRVKTILEKLPNLQLVVSLDAIYKETYQKIRINADYERVMENLKFFKEVSEKHNRHLIISPTYMIHNWEEYPEIMDFATRNNILFETNVLTTPRELSLSNINPDQLQKVKDLWASHTPYQEGDPEVVSSNTREFNKALNQVKFMLDEQKSFYENPVGVKLARFIPENKMEVCIHIIYTHSIKATRDPSIPLKLLELWKSESALLPLFIQSLQKFGRQVLEFDPTVIESLNTIIEPNVNEIFGIENSDEFVKKLMNDEKKFIEFISYTGQQNTDQCMKLISMLHEEDVYVPIEADFF